MDERANERIFSISGFPQSRGRAGVPGHSASHEDADACSRKVKECISTTLLQFSNRCDTAKQAHTQASLFLALCIFAAEPLELPPLPTRGGISGRGTDGNRNEVTCLLSNDWFTVNILVPSFGLMSFHGVGFSLVQTTA